MAGMLDREPQVLTSWWPEAATLSPLACQPLRSAAHSMQAAVVISVTESRGAGGAKETAVLCDPVWRYCPVTVSFHLLEAGQ